MAFSKAKAYKPEQNLLDFLIKAQKLTESLDKRFIEEALKKFKQDCAFSFKNLPNPEEIRLCYESQFSKYFRFFFFIWLILQFFSQRKYAKAKGWKSSKKTVLFWTVFCYCLMQNPNKISFKMVYFVIIFPFFHFYRIFDFFIDFFHCFFYFVFFHCFFYFVFFHCFFYFVFFLLKFSSKTQCFFS